jgi:hypothetical protein
VNDHHVAVAAGGEPADAAPIAGTLCSGVTSTMDVELTILATEPGQPA